MSAAAEKVVPESVLKKQWALEKKEPSGKQRKELREKKKLILQKAGQYAQEYQSQV
jgi:hypothetical protein